MKFVLIFAFCILSCLLNALEYIVKTAKDTNGFLYQYVTNDPFNARIYTLRNGMKVYLSRVPLKPQVTFKMAVRAGLADSPADATGLAHYFEHMMFKGTDKIGALDYPKEKILLDKIEKLFEEYRTVKDLKKKTAIYAEIDRISGQAAKLATAGEYSRLISSIGGSKLNAFTAQDCTVYVVTVPSGEIEKLLTLEAERMRNPVMRLFHTELEAVYEEFNRGRDNDSRMVFEAMSHKLFAPHPYSWIPLIGKPEDLKAPSITRIRQFFKQYYVPANMALALGGDLDFDRTIKMIDMKFSHFPSGKENKRSLAKAAPLQKNQITKVVTPKSEFVRIAFRIAPGRRNELLGSLLAELLSNGTAGLMDRNLVRAQKVLSASASFMDQRDYSAFILSGRPRAGQSLDQLSALLLTEVNKIKQGKFDHALLKGIILNYRKGLVSARNNLESGVWTYLDAFIKDMNYADNLRAVDDLEKLTAQDVICFANGLGPYVRIDKVTGKASDNGKVAKPAMKPVEINTDKTSDYGKHFAELPPSPLPQLDVVDFKKDFTISPVGKWDQLFYSNRPAPSHKSLFDLDIYVNAGAEQDPLLPLAFEYANLLGTTRYSANQLSALLFHNAMSIDFSCGTERSSMNLSGFGEHMDQALKFAAHYLKEMKPDEKVWQMFVARLLKARADAKKNQNANFSALNHWAAYGENVKNNPTLWMNSITEKQLRALTGAEMVQRLRNYFFRLPRMYAYVGPADIQTVTRTLQKTFADRTEPDLKLAAASRPVLLPTVKSTVYLLPYDSQQLLFGIRARKGIFDLKKTPQIMLFNEYFGAGGLDGIVFQEIREARSLAYEAYAYFNSPMETGRYNAFVGVIGTQPDKFYEAADTMLSLFRKMPLYPDKIKLAQVQILKKMASERYYGQLIGYWFRAQKLHRKSDWMPEIYSQLAKLSAKDIAAFAAEEIANGNYDLFIIGPTEKLDRNKLQKYGVIKTVTREQIFGY